MKLWERYCKSCPGKTGDSITRNGYHNWNDSKWLTNLSSFIKLDNPRYIVQKSTIPEDLDFNNFIHKSLSTRDIDNNNVIEYNKDEKEIKRKFEYSKDKFITLNNKVFNMMFRINNTRKFIYVIKHNYAMYLYNDEYIFQGLILGIR